MLSQAVLLVGIVQTGQASTVLKYGKTIGISAGTILRAEGTVSSGILNKLGLTDQRKEVLMMMIPEEIEDAAHDAISKKFELYKKNHGILFSISLNGVLGTHRLSCPVHSKLETQGGKPVNHQAIFTIVERGRSEDVIAAARNAGASGGTILHGRGAGIHETASLFHLTIEPEKEVVMMIAPETDAPAICQAIDDALVLEEPGNGILFTIDVNRVSGLYQN
ncbi:MAG: P-II family nitrogen regulator [Peptoniphilaceae bacterium]|nr:P-II family nitrogen regulator [Peptoniphilaceae bacterium]